ncbi:hypothetical protein ACFQ1E_04195 [Sphingomonas canadensis]|uniref:Uncharacterized protein n=1 Tax=Sphingomonas canadensis TaxID=1219257 RepID=A0ABW3H4C8_9SPHN|nr:hypothetical protein [Sphingomonas canadensis]MCW3834555.1 hypothetical protein [Sphingomonas canadensis]
MTVLFAALIAAALPFPAVQDAAALGRAGTAAFDRGAGAGVTPQTIGEETRCALYWDQWRRAISDGVPSAALLAALPAAVSEEATGRTASAWSSRVMDVHFERNGNLDAMHGQFEREAPALLSGIDNAVFGDVKAMDGLMEMLGICRNVPG